MARTRTLMLAALLATTACADRGAARTTAVDTTTASAPAFTRTAEPAPSGTTPGATPEASGSTAAAASGEPAAADGGAAAPEASPNASPSAAPLPDVEISTYGMHIGGGPNDKQTKAPIREAIMAQRDAFRACFALCDDKSKTGTFGVDLRIPAAGGKAEVSKPRGGLKGPGVPECMIRAFESVEFRKPPKAGAMVVSCSLRFTPKGAK
jgi:hypothetical protein